WYVKYNLALASICLIILLGFVDDVLNLPWGVKLLLPLIAIHPLLMVYDERSTTTISKPLIPFIGLKVLNPGWMSKLYIGLLALFCTNSIKYHTGVNGLKAGQIAVISVAVLIYNIIQIGSSTNPEYQQDHTLSINLVQPLLTTTMALLSFNWSPSSVFVGDTYTYFAGMALLVVGILGNFSETLIIFFTPQILNFLALVPQHFGFIKCPHRSPSFDPQTGLLTGTKGGPLVNIFLWCFGQCSETSLCLRLLAFQALCCITAFYPRWVVQVEQL
ncbi:Udp-n-acetylglucosamine--dolichyl-phosphate n-acetylglucosaminephosphotransferase, partial [Thalictrum thalictroides]